MKTLRIMPGACVNIALAIMRGDTDRVQGLLHHSFALHQLRRIEEV